MSEISSESNAVEYGDESDYQENVCVDDNDSDNNNNFDNNENDSDSKSDDESQVNEKEDDVDETLLPEKLRGKFWNIRKKCGRGSNFSVSVGYADSFLIAIRQRRHISDTRLKVKQLERTENEYRWHKAHMEKLMSRIGVHDNIITYFGLRRVGLSLEMFQEYASGGDLFDDIAKYRALKEEMPEAVVKSRFCDLVRGVGYLHRHGVAHLDIKPENCVLTKWGTLKLCDFDCAIVFRHGITKVPSSCIGSVEYSPPERFIGAHLVRPECADAWACGVILFMLMLGYFPWERAERTNADFEKWLNGARSRKFRDGFDPKFSEITKQLLDPCEETRGDMLSLASDPWIGKSFMDRLRDGNGVYSNDNSS